TRANGATSPLNNSPYWRHLRLPNETRYPERRHPRRPADGGLARPENRATGRWRVPHAAARPRRLDLHRPATGRHLPGTEPGWRPPQLRVRASQLYGAAAARLPVG